MRILLVEDDADFAAEVEREARSIPGCEVIWSASRDTALERIERGDDLCLVILDRRIPTADGVLDDHAEHGWEVFQTIRTQMGGTPVWFLTATEDPDFAADIANGYARQEDLNGRRQPEAMYRVFWKRRIIDCMRELGQFAEQHQALERIAIRPTDLSLDAAETRIIQMFGRRHRGVSADVRSLNGGFSTSRVLRIDVKAVDGRTLITTAAKVSTLSKTADEAERYRSDISRLSAGGFPQLTEKIEAGAGNVGGIFYGIVGETVESLFDRIVGNADVEGVPQQLRGIMAPWYGAKRLVSTQVAQIRRRFVGDTALPRVQQSLGDISLGGVEECSVRAAECCQHGDLHCANVMFDSRGQPMLIDFGDTGPSFSAVDAVTLELSTVFHSQHARLPAGWPSVEDVLNWIDVERFVRDCSFAGFITACRTWATAEAGSADEVVAAAYGYGVRQLKYTDTDKDLAGALVRCCVGHFLLR